MGLEDNVLDSRQERYIDFLTTAPSERGTKTDFAKLIGVDITTLRRWEKREVFRKEWNKRVDDTVGSPERTQSLLDQLFARGMDGDVQSAKLFFQITGRLKPAEVTVTTKVAAAELSDEQLNELIGAKAVEERQLRDA